VPLLDATRAAQSARARAWRPRRISRWAAGGECARSLGDHWNARRGAGGIRARGAHRRRRLGAQPDPRPPAERRAVALQRSDSSRPRTEAPG